MNQAPTRPARLQPRALLSTLRLSPCAAALLLAVAACTTHAADKAPPPAPAATTYADVDAHPAEHVSIAAEPFTGSRAEFFKLNYPAYGVMPVRLIVTNDGDKPISLAQARIDFISAAGDKIPAAQTEDLQRIINTPPNPQERVPLGPIHVGGKGKDRTKQILADNQAYGYASIAVPAHTTVSGFLFYDVSGLDHPLIGAKLEVRRVQSSDGKEMFAFAIPFYKLGANY